MSVETLYDAFVLAASQGKIDAAILPLMGKLTAALGVTELPLAQGKAERLPTAARLTGLTTWADGAQWALTLLGTFESDQDALKLNLEARTARGFVSLGVLAPDQPRSRIPSPDVGGATTLGPSVLNDLGAEQTIVTALAVDDGVAAAPAPRLDGQLVLTGTSLAPFSSILGATQLILSGAFDPRADATSATKVALVAVAPDAATNWPKMGVQAVSLGFTTDYVDAYSLEDPPARISAVLLVLTLTVDTGRSTEVAVNVPLLMGGGVWDITGDIHPPLTLSDGVVALLKLFPGVTPDTFSLPPGVAALDVFGLSQLSFGIATGDGEAPLPTAIAYTGATLVSTTPWDLPIPFMRIEQVGANWLVAWGAPESHWGGSLFGTMRFGSKTAEGFTPSRAVVGADGEPVYLDVTVSLPDLSVGAVTRGAIAVSLSDAMGVFFPGAQPSVDPTLIVDRITMNASLPSKIFGATLTAHGDWTIPIGDVGFTLANVSFDVTVSSSAVWGGLAGVVGVYVDGEQKALLSAGAYYPGDGSWNFKGGLATGELDLTELVYAFLGQKAPEWLPSLPLTRLWAEYSTGAGNPYSVAAAIAIRWDTDVLGVPLSLAAEADIRRRPKAGEAGRLDARDSLLLKSLAAHRPRLYEIARADAHVGDKPVIIYEGAVKGSFELNNLTVTVGLSFISQEKTWLFRLQLDRLSLEARTSWIGEGEKRHQTLTVELEGVTLGAMIESFAALANPNANYRLEPPWTFLNSISLGRFTLIIDPTEQSVTLDYAINLSLGFITITTVGVRYDRKTGEPQVNIEIAGNFLGKDYGRAPGMTPLAWDALNDSPPAIPGEGNRLVNLRYLGFGQHVSLDGLTRPDSLAEIIKLLREQLQTTDDPLRNPLDQPSGDMLHFDESSQWLIGLDVTVMDTVTVKLVMHDPDVYGVLIALAGPQASSLAGFSFELLYKKVTEDIGVFHARLQVPDAFRRLDFGAISVTLGIITVDIFTNGNFKVDLGFPHARDFSVSFGFSYGPFLGKGGLYFGYLNGDTSTSVPAIINGRFSPVIELGIGLTVGVGREFSKGPLKAGAYIQIEVIFEGVLAWFHPDGAGNSTELYYWARGTAALVGKVYGKIDFKIISVDISFEAYAAATLTLAAYRPTLIEMRVGVSVHASIKIFFVRISFSFSTSLDVSFTIGSASTTPWVLSADQSGRNVGSRAATTAAALAPFRGLGVAPLARASHSPRARRRRRPADVARLTRQLARARLGVARDFGVRHPLSAQLAGLDDARSINVDACDQSVYRLNFSPDAKVYPGGAIMPLDVRVVPGLTIADMPIAWSSGAATADEAPAYRVVVMLAIDGPAAAEAPNLEAARNGAFVATARAEDQAQTPFAVLAEGLFRWAVSAIGLDPQSATLTSGDLAELAAQLDCPQTFAEGFAFPNLSGFLGNNVSVRLSGKPDGEDPDVNGVSFPMPPVLGWTSPDLPPPENDRNFAIWQPVDEAYAARIAAYFRKLSPAPGGGASSLGGGLSANESLASVIFREYALLIAKGMVLAAQDLFARFPCDIDDASKLADIAGDFGTITAQYVMHLGDTIEQVAETYGYGAAELLAFNPDLEAEIAAAAPGALIPVTLGVTAESMAAANPERELTAGKTLHAAALEAQIRSGETPEALCGRLGANVSQWLGAAAALDTPSITRAGAALRLPQASFANSTALSLAQVAALFYVRLNADAASLARAPESSWYAEAIVKLNGKLIGADGALPPSILLPSEYDELTAPITWTRLTGDTLPLLAAATSLWENPSADAGFAVWLSAVEALNPSHAGGAVTVPAAETALLPDESLRELAARLLMVTDPTAAAAIPNAAFATLVAPADLLAPLASAVVTQCMLVTTDKQTLRDFATTYDLAIETVGRIGAEIAGLIKPIQKEPLIVPAATAATLAKLMPKLTGATPIRDVAGQVSRFMLHGQRLPAPHSADDEAPRGLYDLVGQQVAGPAPDESLPKETPRLTLTIAPTIAESWIALVQTEVAAADANVASLAARGPHIAARNPALSAGRLRSGMILETADVETLTVTVTEEMLDKYPSLTLTPVFVKDKPPQALQLWDDTPVRYGLPQMVLWQVAKRPPLPCFGDPSTAPSVGMPSFWPFTSNLAVIAASADDKPWQVYRTDPERGPDAKAIAIERFAWSTTIDIRINRVPGRPHTVEVIGADTAGRQLLLELWRHLEAQGEADTADLFFGFQLSPAAGLAGGLASFADDRDATYLVRANLTTETRSGNVSSRRTLSMGEGETPPAGPYFAPMSNALGFLTLLWEASVVGGGYWLDMTNADGGGFDEAIWGTDGNAIVTLVAVLESQAKANPDRRLYSFNNAALIGDPVDTSATALFVAAPDDRDLVRQATVAQGNVGFAFSIVNPPDNGDDRELIARRLYNLAGYRLLETSAFEASNDGLPVSPQLKNGGAVAAMRLAPTANDTSDDDQTVAQVIPIHRFAKSSNAPSAPGLPPADMDPYAGISSPGASAPPVASVVISFHDVFGNSTASAPDGTNVNATGAKR